jgi:3'-phosphoadenosine 5'-phosphosulfate sulfotransferase (PAPS reductase)/FAD synthetase
MSKSVPNKLELWQLQQRQSLPLNEKIQFSINKIREWVNHWENQNVSVSFSGGKDSTVLLDLVRRQAGYKNVIAVFSDTGLEFPEIRDFVKTFENVLWVKPKISFLECLKKYGYPIVSKKVSQYVGECQTAKTETTATYRLRTTGIRTDGGFSQLGMISKKWQKLIKAPFKVSIACCKHLKKNPLSGLPYKPFVGTMATDGKQRQQAYLLTGCNHYEESGAGCLSKPLSIWTEEDIWNYIRQENIPYSKIYDMGHSRTGCMFCPLGLGFEKRPNRFDLMKKTHPQIYKYCMETLGFKEILDFAYGIGKYTDADE